MVTFSIEEFPSILQIKSFSSMQLKLDTNLPYLNAINYLERSKFEKHWLLRV